MKIMAWVLTAVLALSGINAEAAKRLGGGKSVGQQSSNVSKREAAPAQQQNATNNAAHNPATSPPVATPAPAPKRPWGAMLGGLAAGLGLAWLASSLGLGGLGAGIAQFLLFGLLALVIMLAVGWLMRRRALATVAPASPFAFQGAGNVPVTEPRPYRPENVGNDASARPWEHSGTVLDASKAAAGGSIIGSALSGAQNWGVPAGFDTDGFLKAAKSNFVTLQSAWDKADIASLRAMMTDGMLKEIQAQLQERETQSGWAHNHTEVVMLEAHLLGIEELEHEYMASVEFSGMIREEPSTGPNPFREVWNMTKPKPGGGWLVAGVQALQ